MSTTSPASKRPSTALTPTDRSELPRPTSAAFAPSSTTSAPRAASPRAIQSFFGVISWGFFAATKRVPTSSPRAAATIAPARRPLHTTMGMPATMSTRAALIFVIMPPEPTVVPAPPATAMISGPMASTRPISFASGSKCGFASKSPSMSERMTMRSASTRHATSAASVSLSPKRICSTDTVSFSFTMGTTPKSSSRSNVSRACRYAWRSAVSRRVSSTVEVTMPWAANASA